MMNGVKSHGHYNDENEQGKQHAEMAMLVISASSLGSVLGGTIARGSSPVVGCQLRHSFLRATTLGEARQRTSQRHACCSWPLR